MTEEERLLFLKSFLHRYLVRESAMKDTYEKLKEVIDEQLENKFKFFSQKHYFFYDKDVRHTWLNTAKAKKELDEEQENMWLK